MPAIGGKRTYIGEIAFQGFGEASATTSLISFSGIAAAAIDVQSLNVSYEDNIVRWRRGGLVRGMYSPERTARISLQCICIATDTTPGPPTESGVSGSAQEHFKLPGYVATTNILGSMVIGTLQNFTAGTGAVVWLNGLAGVIVSGGWQLQHNEPNQFTVELEVNPNLNHSILVEA